MGKKGRPSRGGLGGLLGGAGRAAAGAARGRGGLTPGRYRVTPRGEIIKLPGKRKKGLRLPKFVNEMLRENLELSKDVRKIMLLQTITGHVGGKA